MTRLLFLLSCLPLALMLEAWRRFTEAPLTDAWRNSLIALVVVQGVVFIVGTARAVSK